MRMKDFPRLFSASVLLAFVVAAGGCKSNQNQNPNSVDQSSASDQNPSQDPANANVAPVSNASDNTAAPNGAYSTPNEQQPTASARRAPGYKSQPSSDRYSTQPDQYPSGDNYDNYNDYETPVAYSQQPPPPLPSYQQPPCPGDGYIWTPGSWQWDNAHGYYWVPGAWVSAPYTGALWTPGWWGFSTGRYGWHPGYWGRHVGYYGGVQYGNGYNGYGYEGGYWRGNDFAYNRTVNNVNTTTVKNVYVYKTTNVVNVNTTRVSYNGGSGGVQSRPRPAEIAAMHEQHNPPMSTQIQIAQQAHGDRQSFARNNNDRPQMVALSHAVQADHNVRPPAPVRNQASNNEPQRTQQQQQQQRAQQEQESTQQQQHAPGANRPQPMQGHQAASEQKRAPMPEQRTQQRPSEPARPAQQSQRPEEKKPAPGQPQHLGPQHPVQPQRTEPGKPETPRASQNKAQQQRKSDEQKKQEQDKPPQ
jgi:hypothetical protein